MGKLGSVCENGHISGNARQNWSVSRFSLAVRHWAGKRRDLGSNPLRLSFLFKSRGLWTLSCDFIPHNYENIKLALIAAHLNAEVILVVIE